MSLRILIADDHKMFRDGLRTLISARDGLEVVAEAADGLSALELAARLKPNLVILDLAMPGLHGLEVIRRLAEHSPDSRVIVLTMHSDRRFVIEALRAGAAAYVLKEAGFAELADVIADVRAGRVYLSPAVSEQVIRDYVRLADAEAGSALAVLSGREREVLELIAAGHPTKAIAAELHLSIKTVESHRKQIMDKLEIRSIAELTKYAIREGLTPLE